MRSSRLWALVALVLFAAPGFAAEAMAPEVTTSNQDRMEYLPQIAYNSDRDEYLVVWHDFDAAATPTRRILARRLDRNGRPLSGPLVVSPTGDDRDRAQAAVAYDRVNDRYLIVYVYDYNGNGSDWDVRGRYASWNLQSLGAERTISDYTDSEWNPKVAFSWPSQTFLVTWTREPATGPQVVRGALVTQSTVGGNLLIATHPSQNRQSPDVAFQPYGDNFLVAYTSGADVFAKTVAATNGALGGEVAVAAWPDAESAPAVASCENYQYVVVWQSAVSGAGNEVYARFLYGDGTIYTAPIHISGTTSNEQRPDVACAYGDIDYVVTYEQQYTNLQYGVSGRRITATQVLRPEFVIRAVGGSETGVTFHPRVAGSREGWLATWEHRRQGSSYQDIHDRAVWSLFTDGFEWGNTNLWSSAHP